MQLNTDLYYGNKPYGEFSPLRFYEDKRERCAFMVLGITKCESISGKCPEFQMMQIDNSGQQWWWKIKINRGEIKCSENSLILIDYNNVGMIKRLMYFKNISPFQPKKIMYRKLISRGFK